MLLPRRQKKRSSMLEPVITSSFSILDMPMLPRGPGGSLKVPALKWVEDFRGGLLLALDGIMT